MADLKNLQDAHDHGVVLGLKKVAGVVPRLDIDELLLLEPDTFNLFVLAFEDLKKDDKAMGYFQIAGSCRRSSSLLFNTVHNAKNRNTRTPNKVLG